MSTAKHKFQKLVFNPANHKLVDFLDELQKLAKDGFGITAHNIIQKFIYAKMPPLLKKSINQAHLENGTYELIVTHLERELERNCFERATGKHCEPTTHKHKCLQTQSHVPPLSRNRHYKNQCRLLRKQ